jgi:hypothetical protein
MDARTRHRGNVQELFQLSLDIAIDEVELRNWLWDEQNDTLMLVDFERAEICGRPPLGTLSPNRKRNIQGKLKSDVKDDEFYQEIQKARASISRRIR